MSGSPMGPLRIGPMCSASKRLRPGVCGDTRGSSSGGGRSLGNVVGGMLKFDIVLSVSGVLNNWGLKSRLLLFG